ncbi:MAG: polysaccharide lyase family protein, partial [Opitutaceae bacterium]
INARVNRLMPTPRDWVEGAPLNMKEARRLTTGRYLGQVEHKYDYSADLFDTPAYGWSSTRDQIGIWFINPSVEYLSGGPTKYELTGHMDLTNSPDPLLLDYWRSTHYGGSYCPIARGESWAKVVGPIFVYCNAGGGPARLWHDALRQARVEKDRWPYAWVNAVNYPGPTRRGSVTGRIRVSDLGAPHSHSTSLLVGLTAPAYRTTGWSFWGPAPKVTVTWQTDAKHYEFWVRARADGSFAIPNVRPGAYVLHAIADGVLGEFVKPGVIVRSGTRVNLGDLRWVPVRYGRQLWDIGIPNRSAREFAHGADYAHWGLYLEYPRWFPHGVNYVIGRSDFRRDWNFEQVPMIQGDGDSGNVTGSPTTWNVYFKLPSAPRGTALLRIALCGVGTRYLRVTMNGRPAGMLDNLAYNAVINRDGIEGTWTEHDVRFSASLLKKGENILQLTIPGGNPTSGLEYDYLRLALVPPKS